MRSFNPDVIPPGGWTYTQPESSYRMGPGINPHREPGGDNEWISYRELIEQIRLHRLANQYDLSEGWEERVRLEILGSPKRPS